MSKPLVSIFIAAFNEPDYTKKTLDSIIKQTYRPIEVIFSDDCSPNSLKPLVEEFRRFETNDLKICYFRQNKNLRGADNMIFGFDKCSGKYAINMPHDDWWLDSNFISESVAIMERSKDCNLCVANSEVENTDRQIMVKLPDYLKSNEKWQIIEGDEYINLLGMDKIGHQAWSAVIFNIVSARSLGAFHYPFNLTKDEADAFDVISDEFFAIQFLLSSIGSVAITDEVVSVRGRPKNCFCSVCLDWFNVVGQSAFIIYYNIYKSDLKGKYAKSIKKRAKETIYLYPVKKLNWKIIRHYHYNPEAIYLMSISYLLYIKPQVVRFINYYGHIIKAVFNKIQKNEPINYKMYLLKIKENGLFHYLFPFQN